MDSKKTSSESSSANKPAEKESFFQSLLSSLFKSSNPEAEKKRRLKNLAKTISKTKYHSFYRPSSGEMLAPFGKLIFDLYKAVSSAQTFFRNTQNPAIFKRQIINYVLSDNQLALLEELDEQKILELAKTVPFGKLSQDVEHKLQVFTNDFNETRATKADSLEKAFSLFQDFCEFDFYMILKKFDSSYQEFSFNSLPRLEKVNAEYIIDDLKDFLTVAYSITDDTIDWNALFDMFKETQSRELISAGNWKKIIAKIKSIQSSKSLDLIVQHISEDFTYETKTSYHHASIIEPYIEKFENDTRNLIAKIEAEQKESKASSICMQIFGTASPQSLKYYTSEFNAPLEKKGLSVLEYTEPLNYLKTFLVEFVKKSIREYYDVVVIRGQWDATLSAPMSNAYQELLKLSDEITGFDEMMAEEGSMGVKVKTLLPKTAHDAGAENIINRVVSDANESARGYIIQGTQNLIVIGKTIKQLIEDYVLPKPVLVANWKELEKFFETPLKEFSVDIYKKIYLFVQLMQNYIS
ncbi:hypothetical protein SAMN04487775_105164 [Treponema bryantii]|uniref:Uncharacterized protein n=1 Tax=Treponema bryantii TaxID=163 RepID=A0A1I3KU30_9SPIR|nr:hypothetical protein [Treponema bryantii]SFI75894.1 hypothetical protein SAMN04487775_105164 [Treponema bryantii]